MKNEVEESTTTAEDRRMMVDALQHSLNYLISQVEVVTVGRSCSPAYSPACYLIGTVLPVLAAEVRMRQSQPTPRLLCSALSLAAVWRMKGPTSATLLMSFHH